MPKDHLGTFYEDLGTQYWVDHRPDMSSIVGIKEVAAGQQMACATNEADELTCWGNDGKSWAAAPGKKIHGINAARDVICGLSEKNETLCLTRRGETFDSIRLHEVRKVRDVVAAGGHRCVVTTKGKMTCHGDNSTGQLGNGNPKKKGILDVRGIGKVQMADASAFYTCALNTKGRVFCWGSILHEDETPKPRDVGLEGATYLAVGDSFACAIVGEGELWCWGENSSGELGDGTNITRDEPARVPLESKVVQVSGAMRDACALLESGRVVCWGDTPFGRNSLRSTGHAELVPVPL